MVAIMMEGTSTHALASTSALGEDASVVLELLGQGDGELSVVLCDDDFIRDLNRQWRGLDAATDVLSFPQESPPVVGGPHLLGDVVISVDTAAAQAGAGGHSLDDELRVLLVHGVLHLLGHDHETAEGGAAMAGEEARLLDGVGVQVRGLIARAPDGTGPETPVS